MAAESECRLHCSREEAHELVLRNGYCCSYSSRFAKELSYYIFIGGRVLDEEGLTLEKAYEGLMLRWEE